MRFIIILIILMTTQLWAFDPQGAVSEDSYNEIIDRAQDTFGPYVALSGNILKIRKTWQGNDRACYTDFARPPVYQITLGGAAFREHGMTNDGMSFVVCHELNHIFGGTPKYSPGYWPSVEGQADYMATNTCLRFLFQRDDNKAVVSKMKIPRELKLACDSAYQEEESAICQRSSMAGFVFAEAYRQYKLQPGEYHRVYPALSFSKKDPLRVRETNRSYGSPQCRLDTAIAGALCEKGKAFFPGSNEDPDSFVCNNRPRCWFKE